jgi:hypothetical protein
MSIAKLIDASVHCGICGTPGVGNCRCFVTLLCPRCKRTQLTKRLKGDGRANAIEIRCPECADVEGAVE